MPSIEKGFKTLILRELGENAAAARYLEARPESGYVRKPYKQKCNRSRFLSACGGLSFALSGLKTKAVMNLFPGAYATRLCALSALRA
jgi:hypothetical protein